MERPVSLSLQPVERRIVSTLSLISALRMFTLFSLLPVLALYAADADGATPALVGFAVGGYGLTQALFQLPFGALSDRFGRRPMVLLGLAIFAVGSIVAGLSEDIFGIIAGRLLQGAGAISAALSALLADHTREEVRTRCLAVLGISIGGAFMLALVFGPVIAGYFGVRFLFVLCVVAAILAALALLLVPPSNAPLPRPGKQSLRDAIRPDLLRFDGYIFVLHASLTAIFVALPFYLRDSVGMPADTHWQVYVSALLLSLVGAIPLIIADGKKGRESLLTIAFLLLFLGLLGLALMQPGFIVIIGSLAVYFAGFCFLEAGLPARVSIAANESSRGAAFGIFMSSEFLGAFAGGIVAGLLLGTNGRAVLVTIAAVAALLLLVQVIVAQRSNSP